MNGNMNGSMNGNMNGTMNGNMNGTIINGTMTENVTTVVSSETVKVYHYRYIREYRAVAVVWAVLTIVWCILNVVCFVEPQWIGDTEESPGYGHLGVYAYCFPAPPYFTRYACNGTFGNFAEILNDSFKASTFFCGVAALIMLICVAALMLFFCFKKLAVFVFCGILELVTAIFMAIACVVYPSGWDHAVVRDICGSSAGEYQLGDCGVRWAYILAIIGIFDAAILAILAFFLASLRVKIEAYPYNSYPTKSDISYIAEDAMSKKSVPFPAHLMVVPNGQDQDRYSDAYSRVSARPPSRTGFQL